MQNLTTQQKKALREWFKKNYDGGYFDMADKIDLKTYDRIYEMHPTKIHYQNVNHYLEELVDE